MKQLALVATIVVALLVLSPVSVAQAAPIVSTPAGTIAVGDTFLLPIWITDADDLWSWQFDLSFNPAVVRATVVAEGLFLSSSGSTIFGPGVVDNTTGLVSLVSGAYVDLPPNPSGDGMLATIQFLALAPGTAAFTLSNVFINLLPVGFDVVNAPFTVTGDPTTPVPEPATALLIAGGLLLLRARRIIPGR